MVEQKMEWRVNESNGPNSGQQTEPRSDQLEAIQNYMTTGKNSKDIKHFSGDGNFNVTFGVITTSYKKENGETVEVMYNTKSKFAHMNRVMDPDSFFRAKKSKKKSKKRSIRLKSLKNIKNRSCKKRSK